MAVPAHADLGVRRAGEMPGGVKLAQFVQRRHVGQAIEEVHPLLRVPAFGIEFGSAQFAGEEIRALAVDRVEARRVGQRCVLRDALAVNPGFDLRHAHLARILLDQVRLHVVEHLFGGDALEREVVKVILQVRVKIVTTETLLKRAQEPRALVVGHVGQRIVGADAARIRGQLLRVGRHSADAFLQRTGRQQGLLIGQRLAIHRLGDAALHVSSEALVEPDVAPGGAGHQVARPRMRQLVRDQRDQALVADQHGRRGECHVRVFHATERERWRQYQNVVAAPRIRAVQLLGGGNQLFGVLELVRGLVDHRRLRIDGRTRAGFLHRDVAGTDRQQVGRNRVRLIEAEVAVQRMLRVVDRAHHHAHVLRRGHMRVVGETDRRRILQRHPRARMDRLGLRKHERQFLVRRLRRRQPLQAGRLGRSGIDDAHLRRMLRRGDGQLAAQLLVARRQCIVQRRGLAVGAERLDLGDLQVARVQHQRLRLGVFPVQLQRGQAGELLVRKVDLQVEIQMRHPHLIGLRVGVRIVGVGGQRQHQCAEGEGGEQAHGDLSGRKTPSMPLRRFRPPVAEAGFTAAPSPNADRSHTDAWRRESPAAPRPVRSMHENLERPPTKVRPPRRGWHRRTTPCRRCCSGRRR